jgi:hypothetical protein
MVGNFAPVKGRRKSNTTETDIFQHSAFDTKASLELLSCLQDKHHVMGYLRLI